MDPRITIAITSFILGFVFGVASTLFVRKENLTTEKTISLLVFALWLSGHVFGFIYGKEIPYIFDALGAGATGTLMGANWTDLFDRIFKLKK